MRYPLPPPAAPNPQNLPFSILFLCVELSHLPSVEPVSRKGWHPGGILSQPGSEPIQAAQPQQLGSRGGVDPGHLHTVTQLSQFGSAWSRTPPGSGKMARHGSPVYTEGLTWKSGKSWSDARTAERRGGGGGTWTRSPSAVLAEMLA